MFLRECIWALGRLELGIFPGSNPARYWHNSLVPLNQWDFRANYGLTRNDVLRESLDADRPSTVVRQRELIQLALACIIGNGLGKTAHN